MNEMKSKIPASTIKTIKRLRQAGMSHRQIAREVGVSRVTIGRYLKGGK